MHREDDYLKRRKHLAALSDEELDSINFNQSLSKDLQERIYSKKQGLM